MGRIPLRARLLSRSERYRGRCGRPVRKKEW
jgi:hypothetical protein